MFDPVGADELSVKRGIDALRQQVVASFVEVNGEHTMTADDDAYVREHFVPVGSHEVLQQMLDGALPLPSYVLSDGTPMVPPAHGDLATVAGGTGRLHDWFVAFWPDDPGAGEDAWRDYLAGRWVSLREVTPIRMRQQAARVAEAADAVERLRRDPHDPVGRGMLGEAVDGVMGVIGLDALLLPMTGYDRRRFAGPTVREQWVDAPRAAFLTPASPDLPLLTPRLVLRPFAPGDEAAFAEAWADPAWTAHLLSEPMGPAEVADWVRRRSQGPVDGRMLGLVVEHEGVVVGDVMLVLQGTGLTEGEIGWSVLPGHQGRGFATEAAEALLRLAFGQLGLRRVVANLDARNRASAALAERLGMRLESRRLGDWWSKGRWTDSLEYALLAEEWRAG